MTNKPSLRDDAALDVVPRHASGPTPESVHEALVTQLSFLIADQKARNAKTKRVDPARIHVAFAERIIAALSGQVVAPCPHCDDTGDVHRADGEWLGRCSCAAGQSQVVADTIDLRDAAIDALAGWKYIRANHGDLYGVGWDRVQDKLERALAADHTQGEA